MQKIAKNCRKWQEMSVQSISISPALALVLNSAGDKSGVDFDYLVQTAMRESSLNPNAKAKTSSATGLFQFIEATWLEVVKEEGARLGYKKYSNAIVQNSDGRYLVSDKSLRTEILELRKNPQIAADMAAAFTKRNGQYLENRFGRQPSAGELYIAHFLGARGAEKLFAAGLKNPDQIAANLFPSAAKANKAIFYENGQARTIKQVYKSLIAKHNIAPVVSAQFATQQLSNDVPVSKVQEMLSQSTQQLEMSFKNMFLSVDKNEPNTPLSLNAPSPLVPLNSSKISNGENRFFVQLYNK